MSASDDIPRRLPERTGVHRCISCLEETPAEAYLANDHLCDACAARDAYPLASTPAPAPEAVAAPPRRRRAGGR